MKKGIANQGIINIRREPSHASELISQLLFGETCHLLDSRGHWGLVSSDLDGSEGWLVRSCLQPFEQDHRSENSDERGFRMVSHPVIVAKDQNGTPQYLPAGAIWPRQYGKSLSLFGKELHLENEEGLVYPSPDVDPEAVGKRLLSLPYLWGGRSGFGFDAPGLVQMVGRMMGISLPRTCPKQSELGSTVNFLHEIRTGDLAFFNNPEGEIVHVGMALHGGRILHASNQVRIDRLDQHGIFDAEIDDYTHKLRIVKRVKEEPHQGI